MNIEFPDFGLFWKTVNEFVATAGGDALLLSLFVLGVLVAATRKKIPGWGKLFHRRKRR